MASEVALLMLLLGVAAAARLHDLDGKSIWLDEAFSIYVAQQPLDRMIEVIVRHDTPPPLYYLLLHFWMGMGTDPFSVRLLSALLGVAAVVAIYLLGREVGGQRVAFPAALLMALSPFQVWYGQEARMYALLALLGTLSAYFLLRALERGGSAAWIGYVVATSLATYTQPAAAFLLLGEGVAALLLLTSQAKAPRPIAGGKEPVRAAAPNAREPSERSIGRLRGPKLPAALRPWLLSQVAIVLLWLPWLPSFLRQSQTYRQFWIEVPTRTDVQTLLFEFTSAYLPHWLINSGQEVLIGGALLLALLAARRIPLREYLFLVILFVVPVAAMYLMSQAKPIFLSRALIYAASPYLALVAGGTAAVTRWRMGTVLLGLFLLLNVVSLYRMYTVIPKEEWDLAASHLTSQATPGDLVLFVAADAQIPFDYYADRQPKQLERRGLPVDVFTVGPLEPRVEEGDLAHMDDLVGNRESFWLVDSHTAFADPDGLARRHADDRFRLEDEKQFEGITVLRYRTKSGG
ncbi:MAG: glycosyltransferase family 39 protein [Chloroflexota bacterium]